MATSVISAFKEFMTDSVNLDSEDTINARKSRDNLLENISNFNMDEDFFHLYKEINIQFGSFARYTKIRPLDDIDLMIGISADGATYRDYTWDNVVIYTNSSVRGQKDCMNLDGTLNSIRVLNAFKSKLKSLPDYSRSDIKYNQEAVVLNLKSRDWSYDIVPCYITAPDVYERSYYLIPDGTGRWKKTDPRKDRSAVTEINQKKDERVLDLIRLAKKWNSVKKAKTIPSYLLETIIVKYAETQQELSSYINYRFKDFLINLKEMIYQPVFDLKEIQGDINTLSYQEKIQIEEISLRDYKKAKIAIDYESKKDYKKSIDTWREILGSDFPTYG